MITAILQHKEIPVLHFDIKYMELKIPEFSITVSAEHIPDPAAIVFADVALYKNGQLLESGLISEYPLVELGEGDVTTCKIKCDTDLGRLYLEMAADIQFQNVSVGTAINTLFAQAQDSTWSINSSATLAAENITLDVRDKESLWAQIKYVLDNASEPVFMRYVGFNEDTNTHQVDIGSFGSNVRTHNVIKGENVVGEPKFRQMGETPILEIRPISGKVGAQPVRLSEALNLEPSLSSDPYYPLQSSTQSVLNATITTGRRLRKRFTAHKTSNAAPVTATERAEVALSLYYRSVREIKAAVPFEELKVEVFLPSPPALYDNVFVDIIADMMVYDPLTEVESKVRTVAVRGFYRVKGWQLKYKSNLVAENLGENQEGELYSIDFTNGYEIESPEDKSEVIDRKLQTNDLEDNAGIIIGVLDTVDVPVTHSGISPDCNFSGPNTGKTFTFPLPTVPSGATAVSTEVISANPSTTNTSTVIQAATLSLPLIICASGAGGLAWTIADNTTITVRYTFTA